MDEQFMIYVVLYILAVVAANLTAGIVINLFIAQFALGTIFFGAIFTLRDLIHNKLGRKYAYIAIALAFLCTLILSFMGSVPFGILIASLVALIISESTDTEIYHKLKNKSWIFRVLASNSVSIPLDTIIFVFIAFYGVWPLALIISVIIGDIVVKFIISSIIMGVKQWSHK